MKKIGVYVKRNSPEAGEVAGQSIQWLRDHGCEPLFDEEVSSAYGIPGGVSFEKVTSKSEILLVLGGDGTFLAAARAASAHDIPILGVNLGSLGFLTETPLSDLYPMLNLVVEDRAAFEQRGMLDVILKTDHKTDHFTVLNDVVVGKSALARIIQIKVTFGDDVVTNMLADGLIVSTPTGSTAYSMAAGGPICHPSVKAVILTPICPHLLANRPLLVPETAPLRIELVHGGESFVTMDGQVGMEFKVGDVLEVVKAETTLKYVRSPKRSYFKTLRDKLRWGKR